MYARAQGLTFPCTLPVPQEEEEVVGCEKLGGSPESPVPRVIGLGELEVGESEGLLAQGLGFMAGLYFQALQYAVRHVEELSPVASPEILYLCDEFEHSSSPVSGLLRDVGAGEEWALVWVIMMVRGQPPLQVIIWQTFMQVASMSGRSSRSTLIEIKVSFKASATSSSSKDSLSMT